jgi:hypothetical protein
MKSEFLRWRPLLCLLALPTGEALAYKPNLPRRHDLLSPNHQFVADVDPSAKRFTRCTIYSTANRRRPLWSLERGPVGFGDYYLSNDGKVLAYVHWRYVMKEDLPDDTAIEFWNETGRFKAYTVGEVCPRPARARDDGPLGGPMGEPWRDWHRGAESDGDQLRVRTTDGYESAFSLADGSMLSRRRVTLWAWMPVILAAVGLSAAVVAFAYLLRRWWRARNLAPIRTLPDKACQ